MCIWTKNEAPVQVLGKYFDVYGQACPITPEARKKKAPFYIQHNYIIYYSQ